MILGYSGTEWALSLVLPVVALATFTHLWNTGQWKAVEAWIDGTAETWLFGWARKPHLQTGVHNWVSWIQHGLITAGAAAVNGGFVSALGGPFWLGAFVGAVGAACVYTAREIMTARADARKGPLSWSRKVDGVADALVTWAVAFAIYAGAF